MATNEYRPSVACASCLMSLLIYLTTYAVIALILKYLLNWLLPIFWVDAPVLTFLEVFGICITFSIILGIIVKMFK